MTFQCNACHRQTSLIHHKLMQAMAEREDRYRLSGAVQMDDAYLCGEHSGGKAGRGSENKVPFVAAVSVDDENHPVRIKLTPVSGFTTEAVTTWSKGHISAAGCFHVPLVVGGHKPDELPEVRWVNTVLGNVKTSLSGIYHALDFSKYARRYLGTIANRFNRRFQFKTLPERLLVAAVSTGPRSDAWLRLAEDSC